jgi:thymidylate synthase
VKIRASTLDDVLHIAFDRLLRTGKLINPAPTKGRALEALGVVIELTNPRARMSRSEARHLLFSCLGELLWYLSGDDSLSFIRYYIPSYPEDGKGEKTVRAAYGPRLRTKDRDQLRWVIAMLKERPSTRRAVIPIFSEADTQEDHSEVPCTCTLQFLVRSGRLELITHMRSNDAYLGLASDVFAFTMIQEIVARSLGVEIGTYKHLVGSFHLYECKCKKAEKFLEEGWQTKHTMPLMPLGDQFRNIDMVLSLEKSLRAGGNPSTPLSLPEYWQDIVQLLRIHKADVEKAPSREINRLRKGMHSEAYVPYIESKRRKAQMRETGQPEDIRRTLFPL